MIVIEIFTKYTLKAHRLVRQIKLNKHKFKFFTWTGKSYKFVYEGKLTKELKSTNIKRVKIYED